jgi:hypothetical protein
VESPVRVLARTIVSHLSGSVSFFFFERVNFFFSAVVEVEKKRGRTKK